LTKVSRKRVRSPQEEIETKVKHSKESEYCLNQPSTSNRCTTVLKDESEYQRHNTSSENMREPPPIYLSGVQNMSLVIQLLEQRGKQEYEIKALAEN
jgi:hypothetical protein